MTDKETMPEELWVDATSPDYKDIRLVWGESDYPMFKYIRHDTAISKKALIELLEGKRKVLDLYGFNRGQFKEIKNSGRNALIDELIKEIE